MDLGINGRKALVCASSRGLGRACAEALANEGVEVFINGGTTPGSLRRSKNSARPVCRRPRSPQM
jgi:3-oxoacyl-[acyl-carrier protein] reductase